MFWVGPDREILTQFANNSPGGRWADHPPVPITAPGRAQHRTRVVSVARRRTNWTSSGSVLTRKKRLTPPVPAMVTGEVEARLVALACSALPAEYARWSLRLLEKHVALVDDIPDLDHSTIGRVF